MPYSRIYISGKTRKNLKRLAKEYDIPPRRLLKEMVEEYYNLMTLFEVEVGDAYSERKYRQSQKAKIGMFPLVRIPEKIKDSFDKELAIHEQSKFRFLTRIVAMGQGELEDDLSEKIARVLVVRNSMKEPTDLTLEEWMERRNFLRNKGHGKPKS